MGQTYEMDADHMQVVWNETPYGPQSIMGSHNSIVGVLGPPDPFPSVQPSISFRPCLHTSMGSVLPHLPHSWRMGYQAGHTRVAANQGVQGTPAGAGAPDA